MSIVPAPLVPPRLADAGRPRVLRLASVFPVPDRGLAAAGYDPVGGMQNHTGQLSAALDRLGVPQTVLTAYRPGAARREALGDRGEVLRVGLPTRRLRQGYGPAAARAVATLPGPYDLVHAHLGEDAAVLLVALAAARRFAAPLVVTVHLSPRHTLTGRDLRSRFLRTVGGAAEAAAVRRAAAVITLTDRLAAVVGSRVPAGRVHVVPSGVRSAAFAAPPAEPAGLPAMAAEPAGLPAVAAEPAGLPATAAEPGGVPAVAAGVPGGVLFVGRLHRQKGLDTLVRAVPLLPADCPVTLAGDGPERAALQRLAAGLGVADRVTVTGFLPHRAVPGLLAGARVAVLPSRYEELGTALVEAMAAGRPVVASRVGGIPELVRDGVDGLLVPPEDPVALAAAIGRLLADPALAAELGANGRARVAGHDWGILAGRVLDIYRVVGRPAVR